MSCSVGPTHPLAAAPDPASNSQLEGREHFLQRAAFAAEHDAGANLNGWGMSASDNARPASPLPIHGTHRKKSLAGSASLRQNFIATAAINPIAELQMKIFGLFLVRAKDCAR